MYENYLLSDHWREKRKQRLELDNYKCQICLGEEHLHVHHLNYKNIGNEDVNRELITLCGDCHTRLHRQLDETQEEFEKIIEEVKTDLRVALKPVKDKWGEVQGELLSKILFEYSEKELLRAQTIARILRETRTVDWNAINFFNGVFRSTEKQVHSTSLKKLSQKRKRKLSCR